MPWEMPSYFRRRAGRLVVHSPDGFLSSTGEDLERLETPARTVEVAFATREIGLARADGGFLWRTDDGARTWAMTSPRILARAGPFQDDGVVRVVLDDGRQLELDSSGETHLSRVETPDPDAYERGIDASAYAAAIAREFPFTVLDEGPDGVRLVDLGRAFLIGPNGSSFVRTMRLPRRLGGDGWIACENYIVRDGSPPHHRCLRMRAGRPPEVLIDQVWDESGEHASLRIGSARVIPLGDNEQLGWVELADEQRAWIELLRFPDDEEGEEESDIEREELLLDLSTGERRAFCGPVPYALDSTHALRVDSVDESQRLRFGVSDAVRCPTWRELPAGADHVCFNDARHGFARSQDGGRFWITRDAGASWTVVEADLDRGPEPAHMRSPHGGGERGCRYDDGVYATWGGESSPVEILPAGSRLDQDDEPSPPDPAFHLSCQRTAPSRDAGRFPLVASLPDYECGDSGCTAIIRWFGGGRAERVVRYSLPNTGPEMRCATDTQPHFRPYALGDHGALASCSPGSRCGCTPGNLYWIQPEGSIRDLEADNEARMEEALSWPVGVTIHDSARGLEGVVFHVGSDRYYDVEAGGRMAFVRGMTFADDMLAGTTARNDRLFEAAASPDGTALRLFDVSDLERAEERIDGAARWPSGICADGARGIEIEVGADHTQTPSVSFSDAGQYESSRVTTWRIRVGAQQSCVSGVSIGSGPLMRLVARGGALRGMTHQPRVGWREAVCNIGARE